MHITHLRSTPNIFLGLATPNSLYSRACELVHILLKGEPFYVPQDLVAVLNTNGELHALNECCMLLERRVECLGRFCFARLEDRPRESLDDIPPSGRF
jgi:hypothetical protein